MNTLENYAIERTTMQYRLAFSPLKPSEQWVSTNGCQSLSKSSEKL